MEAAAQPAPPSNARRIRVSGFPAYTQPQDLTRVFGQYGAVKVDKVTERFAVLTFTQEDEAQEAIDDSYKVNIYGEFLAVKPYTDAASPSAPREPTTPKREFVHSKLGGEIIEPQLISLAGDFYTQLDNILAAVRLTQEEVTNLSSLYIDLEWVLQQLWPGSVAHPFGSITTGLGIKSSDADCFIQVPAAYRTPNANFVNKAKKLLQQYPRIFAEVLAIPRANTPIVKFFHNPTHTNCDVSFKTPLGARNSKLIAFLLHADPRLLPMAVVIKYWAKVHGFSGTGKLSNYALTMLIIFYLQQPPAVLPPVEWLQRDRADDIIVDEWNTGFMHNYQLLPTTTNNSSISELLGGFFQYYSTFSFEDSVVCPLTGYPMKKKQFKDLNSLPPEFDRYKRNLEQNSAMPLRATSAMCVQDPIELSHNVASAVSSRLAADIKAYFKFAAAAYETEKNKQFASFFKIILLQKPKLPKRGCQEFRVVMYPHMLQCIANDDWRSVVREVTMTLFEDMCKIPLTKVEQPPSGTSKKLKERYTGTVVKAIWKRKAFNRIYSFSKMDFTKKQTRITEEILNVDKGSFKVKFQLTMTFASASRNVSVTIKFLEGDQHQFQEFGQFFLGGMQSWFITLLRPHFHPPKKTQKPVANGSKSESEQPEKADENCIGVSVEIVEPDDQSDSELADNVSRNTDANSTDDLNNTGDLNDTKTSDASTRVS